MSPKLKMSEKKSKFMSAKELLLSNQFQSRQKSRGRDWDLRAHPYKNKKLDRYEQFFKNANFIRDKEGDDDSPPKTVVSSSTSSSKKIDSTLTIPTAARPFRPPFKRVSVNIDINNSVNGSSSKVSTDVNESNPNSDEINRIMEDPRAKNLDRQIVGVILDEIYSNSRPVEWSDISGLEYAKSKIKNIAIKPLLKPHLYVGCLEPAKGLLLFGPPGTGKTLLARCIASQSNSTFFSISASSLTSKWIGEGEKSVRALFSVARIKAPSIIFIDEIDSLFTSRNDSEHESSRRMKTEFLVQMDGLNSEPENPVLVIGATNRPHELDQAFLRRLQKRFYIALPDSQGRKNLIQKLLCKNRHTLTDENFEDLSRLTEGYSGADLKHLCAEAAELALEKEEDDEDGGPDVLPPITHQDFIEALDIIKPSVSEKDLDVHIDWNNRYGTIRRNLKPS